MVPLGGPHGCCLPAKLKGWAKCGSWRGPPRPRHARGDQTSSTEAYFGCPLPWQARVGINPIATLETPPLNMIGTLA
jgi:hypothetical protein